MFLLTSPHPSFPPTTPSTVCSVSSTSTMSRVSFAGNTKTDSPARAYRQAVPLTSTKFDLQLHRSELRYNMHRKIVVCEHEKFFEQFMGSSAPRTYTNNLFAALETPTTESQMYDTLVSRVLTFRHSSFSRLL